ALRKSVTEEIETRIAKAAEAAEAARSGTQRVDRELSDVKTDAARITQRLETLKADNQRFSDALAAAQAEAGKVSSALDALRSDVGQRFKSVAKPDDVAAAVAPVTARLDGIEKRVDTVVTAEQSRKASAERIVLSLELANLKRAVDRGIGYADELAQVKKAAGGKIDLAALEPSKSEGVPTLTELQASFRPLSHQIIDAASEPADGGVVDRLLAGAKSIVRVRKVDHRPDDDSVEAVVGRMDRALEEGRITDFVSLAEKLPARAKAPAAGLMQKVEARHAVDKALAEIQTQLKATLGSAGEAASATAK
ncbi:MAG: COG4223 family protein, partial [Hyphomicrobiaceae bacterium]